MFNFLEGSEVSQGESESTKVFRVWKVVNGNQGQRLSSRF